MGAPSRRSQGGIAYPLLGAGDTSNLAEAVTLTQTAPESVVIPTEKQPASPTVMAALTG